MSNYSTRPDVGTGGRLMGALTRNPEGLLLLAAGCALLMRKASATRPIERGRPHDESRGTNRDSQHNGHNGHERNMGESLAHAARSAGEYASDMAERVTETASSYASSVSDYADEATERSRRIARQAQSTLRSSAQHILQEQPLAVALAGLAVGAAVAATFPATEVEKRALGPTGDRFLDAAGRAGEHLKEAGAQAGERLMNAAEERGLTRDGLKDVAQEVGDAFSSALSGEQKSATKRGQDSEGSRGTPPPGRPKQPGGASRSAQQTINPQPSQGTGGSPQVGQSRTEGASSAGSSRGQPNSAGKRGPE
jgi:hypothetical protein